MVCSLSLVYWLLGGAYKISLVPDVQIWRVKQSLINLNKQSTSIDLKLQSVSALVASGSLESAWAIISNIEDDSDRAFVIQSLAKNSETLKDSGRIALLLNKLFGFAEGINDARKKADSILALAESISILDDQDQMLALFERLKMSTDGIDKAGDKAKIFQALAVSTRSEEHTSELQSRRNLVCRLLLEKKKTKE